VNVGLGKLESIVPSPLKSHANASGFFVLVFVNVTVNGKSPVVGLYVKSATGNWRGGFGNF
jgi:hypothetical protein